jgi:hypothetical protein
MGLPGFEFPNPINYHDRMTGVVWCLSKTQARKDKPNYPTAPSYSKEKEAIFKGFVSQ